MKKIVIIGVGALGSHVALFLRNLHFQKLRDDVQKLVVVDFKPVQQKNVMAQFHSKTALRKNKAESLKQTLNFLFGISVDAIPHKLHQDNARALLGDASLVLDCLDNGASRRVVQGYVREMKVPCLHGAVAADGTIGVVSWDDKFTIDDEDGLGATCEDGEHLPFLALVAANIARSAQEFMKSGQQMSFQVFSRSPTISL